MMLLRARAVTARALTATRRAAPLHPRLFSAAPANLTLADAPPPPAPPPPAPPSESTSGGVSARLRPPVDGAAPKKTGTVYDSLYPTWARERFELRVNRKNAVLRCRVLDAPPARGEPPRPVGTCSLPLGDLGERSKTLWLPLTRAPSAVKTCVEIKQ